MRLEKFIEAASIDGAIKQCRAELAETYGQATFTIALRCFVTTDYLEINKYFFDITGYPKDNGKMLPRKSDWIVQS